MRNIFDRTVRRMATVIRRLKEDQAGEIPMDVGFPFSAWFFVTVVALTLLDTYVLGGQGIGSYLGVPTDVLNNARAMVNI